MIHTELPTPSTQSLADKDHLSHLRSGAAAQRRSGAVARMLHMPVATLRVCERRYGLTQLRSHRAASLSIQLTTCGAWHC